MEKKNNKKVVVISLAIPAGLVAALLALADARKDKDVLTDHEARLRSLEEDRVVFKTILPIIKENTVDIKTRLDRIEQQLSK